MDYKKYYFDIFMILCIAIVLFMLLFPVKNILTVDFKINEKGISPHYIIEQKASYLTFWNLKTQNRPTFGTSRLDIFVQNEKNMTIYQEHLNLVLDETMQEFTDNLPAFPENGGTLVMMIDNKPDSRVVVPIN